MHTPSRPKVPKTINPAQIELMARERALREQEDFRRRRGYLSTILTEGMYSKREKLGT